MSLNLHTIQDLVFRGYAEVMPGVRGYWLTEKGLAFVRGLQLQVRSS